MSAKSTKPLRTVDWANEAVWVQNRTLYLVVDQFASSDDAAMVTIQDQKGEKKTVLREELERTHFALQKATVYKSRYAPIRALFPAQDCRVLQSDHPQNPIDVNSDEALLCYSDGSLDVVSRHEFDCTYTIVGGAGALPPS